MKKYVYIFVRKDLSHAQQVVQSTHSILESTRHFIDLNDEHPSVIVFGIKNENKLRVIAEALLEKDIKIKQFFEPDIGNQLTSIATEPIAQDQRHHFSKYCLLK